MNNAIITYSQNNEVHNRLLILNNNETENIVVFVAGWSSTPSTWRYFIPILQQKSSVHYFETREKAHTRYIVKPLSFGIESMSSDLVYYLNNLQKKYILMGASVGASVIINSLSKLSKNPVGIVLLTPNNRVKLPAYFQVLRIIPVNLLQLIRPLILILIKKFSFKADAHKIEGLINAMNSVAFAISKKSILQLSRMNLLNGKIGRLKVPTLIVATNRDSLHNLQDSILFQNTLGADIIRFETFTEAHSSKCAKHILEWSNNKNLLL